VKGPQLVVRNTPRFNSKVSPSVRDWVVAVKETPPVGGEEIRVDTIRLLKGCIAAKLADIVYGVKSPADPPIRSVTILRSTRNFRRNKRGLIPPCPCGIGLEKAVQRWHRGGRLGPALAALPPRRSRPLPKAGVHEDNWFSVTIDKD
jgi:hypothetical protein